MDYTKATEHTGSTWSFSEFTSLHGNFGAHQEYSTKLRCGIFNDKGACIYVHIEKKLRDTPISEIIHHQQDYEVTVLDICKEYCLYKKGDIIDYSAVWEDLHPYEVEERDFDLNEFLCQNSDIFDGEVT